MFKNIMIPIDGSDLAAKAVEQGVLFAKEIGAKITAVAVTEPSNLLSVRKSTILHHAGNQLTTGAFLSIRPPKKQRIGPITEKSLDHGFGILCHESMGHFTGCCGWRSCS
jgi:hypothetical protein